MIAFQVPAPPTPPPVPEFPVEIFTHGPAAWIPIAGMLTGVVIMGMFLVGPVGRAIGDILRHWLTGRRAADTGETALPADVDELHARIDQLQRQVAELAERQDFSERLLAQARREQVLPGSRDVAG